MDQEMEKWKKRMPIHKFVMDEVNTKLNMIITIYLNRNLVFLGKFFDRKSCLL